MTRKPGYHITAISRGTFGEISKIQEEYEEFVDAGDPLRIIHNGYSARLRDIANRVEARKPKTK